MSLSSGTRLGPYEILAPIGAGGMGEVYRARDTRLNRDVAIKVLPAVLAHDPERMARFEREARLLASLDHPNIGAIYGLEESQGTRALILALIEGPTLADRIATGPIPVEEAIHIAQQMAEALEYAHERGVIHRDLKPANVKITPDGVVKVLDFGLAKALTAESDSPPGSPANSPTMSPTLSMRATQAGMILGTAAYMAPEQAKGKTVDRRADIWAFGVVFFEMLTGEDLFTGDTAAEILASAIKEEPRLERLPASTPATIRRLIARCLNKDPKQRLQAIGEARILLAGPLEEAGAVTVSAPSQSRLGRVAWTVMGALMVVAVVGFAGWYRATHPADPPLKPLVRLNDDLGIDVSLAASNGSSTILSPDGTRLVYLSQNRLFTRRLDQQKAAELAGTEGAFAPFFSPDGQWIAFFAGSKLKKISVEGGAAIALSDANSVQARGGSWGEDGNIIVALNSTGSVLSRVPSAGGTPTPVTQLTPGEATHRWPQVLPGAKAVLFTAHTLNNSGFDAANIDVVTFADHHRKTLVRGGTFGRYLATPEGAGYLVYVNRGTLFAVPFDLDTLAVRGTPVLVVDNVAYSTQNGSAQFDFARSGTLVYQGGESGGAAGLVTVQWLDSSGKTQPLLAKPGYYQRPRLSPDGQHVFLEVSDGSDSDIWAYDFKRDTMTRLTFGNVGAIIPVPSPDGRYVLFSAPGGIFWTRADAAAKPQPLTQTKNRHIPQNFTPDGRRLAYQEATPGNGYDIWTVPIENDSAGLRAGKPEPFLQTPADERQVSFSPDARWISYTSDESGTYQVYVRAFPDKGGKWQVSNAGGESLKWSRDGREMFFRGPDNRIMVAAYTAKGDSFVAEKPRVWSEKPTANLGFGVVTYDLAPDGKRVAALMAASKPETPQAQNHVTFLMNFFDELRRKLPTSK